MKSKDLLALAVSFAVAAILFTEAATTLAVAVIAVLGYFVFYVRSRKAIALTLSCGLSLIAFETIGSIVIRRAIARDYLPGRDHRMKPNPDKGINSDGILCDTEADAFADDAFNIIFLGDSFTFGLLLEDSNDAFPFQVERMIRARRPDLRANCINFGWTSSSPLLSYRLLTEIGSKYKPDIVVFALDLTDFHDDLLYRHHDDPMERSASAFMLHKAGLYNFYLQLRQRWRLGRLWSGLHGESLFIPDDRFFAVNQPLSLSQPYMLETEIQLRKIADYCKSTLNAEFIVVFPPRSFQYSAVECPDNWERHSYSVLGPFVRQPFVWFDHFKARVDFPCYSLLEALENAAEFPLFFRDDPHWTAAGHKVIAGAVMDILEKEGRLNSD